MLLFWLFLSYNIVLGQNQPWLLKEVVVSDLYQKKIRKSIVQKDLKDSINSIQNTTITNTLQNSAPFYIKENGKGMVSSIALRGTTASQTVLVWNGININSQLTGQTDLNTINPQIFEQISINLGGGSTLYNSGAIAGSIHLDNPLIFKPLFKNTFQFSLGSFNTRNAFVSSKYANEKFAFSVNYAHQKSDNDYEFIGTPYKNTNGNFHLNSGNFSLAYQINSKNIIKFYTNIFIGNRNLSPSIAAVSNAKYLDKNFRNLATWTFSKNKFQSDFKYAFLREEYQYFQDKDIDNFTFGNVNQQILKLDLKYNFNDKTNVTYIFSYQNVKGNGSNIQNIARNIFDYGVLFHYQFKKYSGFELQIKQEKSTDFESPILYSIGNYSKINSFYTIKTQISRNYRIPTFNDMYWVNGGNINLNPENSNQININNQLKFKSFNINFNAYYISISNMIQWVPNPSGLWQPINNEKVTSKGLEFDYEYKLKINNHLFKLNLQYAYTNSTSKNTNLQLIYVPFNKVTSSLNYQKQNFSCSLFGSYNAEVFTTTDHSNKLKPYFLWNSQFNYQLKSIKIGLSVENISNQFYQNVLNRPLPGRNYNLQIQYKL